MKALITGINGFVGGYLAEHLLNMDTWQVWGVGRGPTLALAHLHDHVVYRQADLTATDQIAAVLDAAQPDVIFHLASQAFVPAAFRDPATTLQNNILGQLTIFQAMIAQQRACRVLVVGSSEVYGMVTPADLPLNEDTPLRPANPYSVSKVAQDMLALQYWYSHQLDVVRVRPFNHIGPRQDDRFVAAAFAHQVAGIEQGLQPPILKVGNLDSERDFTDVRDMVRAYALAVEHGQSGAVYNIGSGTATRVRSLLDMLLEDSPADIAVQPDPARMRPVQVPRIVCDARRFHAQTGWEPTIPLAQTLHDVLAFWRTHVSKHQS